MSHRGVGSVHVYDFMQFQTNPLPHLKKNNIAWGLYFYTSYTLLEKMTYLQCQNIFDSFHQNSELKRKGKKSDKK